MSQKPKVSVLILDYMKGDRVVLNVESIQKQETSFPVEIVVVDNSNNPENAAKLKPLERYENVKVVINDENKGYIGGYNQAVEYANGEYLLIVNPDIHWRDTDTITKLVAFMENNPKVGICGPKEIDEGEENVAMTVRAFPKIYRQVARRTFLRNLPIIKQIVAYDEMRHLDYDKTQAVDWLQSSFLIMSRELWDKLGGLNKDYFIFMADPDLCFRCWDAGYEVVYYPEAVVYADGLRVSAGGFKDFFKKWTMRQHLKDSIKYRLNYFGKGNPRKRYFKKNGSSEYKGS